MTGEERRKTIIDAIKNADEPLSGSALGRLTGVSRQVVVQDIALLRAQDYSILSTNRGYILNDDHKFACVLKMKHDIEQTEDEMNTIVDLGGAIVDVTINHRVYGKITAKLNIHSRRDITKFLKNIQEGISRPLMTVTSGYHFHTVSAASSEILADIETALQKKGYLARILPYENI